MLRYPLAHLTQDGKWQMSQYGPFGNIEIHHPDQIPLLRISVDDEPCIGISTMHQTGGSKRVRICEASCLSRYLP